ncbi:response regulator receiver protein [Salinihabitans flavidus]|uniref:Response regulator receiver protein n=1 Tax=Salinihabitans flavidus TaxID=569882 RepID=A0A1H8QJ15_9RHOB|nr:response regulator [Salinihabitans flavidus]SEO54245.1 response regulator receiver protein [Salinihabitans flavidus]
MSTKDRLHVMVVDDMSTSRALITQALDEIGIVNYRSENDGAAAMRSLSASPVHLVISDYNMPGVDGLQLLEALRRNKVTQRIGFILITGRADQEIIDKGRKLAMNNFLRKPFSVIDLKACIEKVVGKL